MGGKGHVVDPSPSGGMPQESAGQVLDELCEEFEGCWRDGARPRIEDYLARAPVGVHSKFLSELVGIELYWRRRQAEAPSLEEYHRRFPDDRGVVDRQFDRSDPTGTNAKNDAAAQQETLALGPETVRFAKNTVRNRFGNYELMDEIGRGGMGVVYRARQPGADRHVALKVIRRDRLESLPKDYQATVIQRFHHEAQAAGRIEHDHIVTVHEVGEVDGEHFFSMRLVEGCSLSEMLEAGPLDGRRAARYIEPVARAVHEAHLHGILHRDIKPPNILIDAKTDRALVADFGLAKLAEEAGEMTRAGDVMGTPQYMSPEQARDSSRVTAKSDIYSLGATLYFTLTGQPPFQATTLADTIRQVLDEKPTTPRHVLGSIDRDIETICLKCLEKEPSRRYGSAELLADELQRYLRGEPIKARPVGPGERLWRWCRRNPVTASSIAAALAFLMVALVAATVGYVQTSASLAIAETEHNKSERNYQRARDAVDRFFTHVSENELLDQPGMQPLRQDLLEEATAYYNDFLEERGDDPNIQDELAATHFRLGRIRELIDSPQEARQAYRKARQIQRRLLQQRPDDAQRLAALGDTANRIGRVNVVLQEFAEAEVAYREAIEVRERLAAREPGETEHRRSLANTYMNLGLLSQQRGEWDAARQQLEQAQAIRDQLAAARPPDAKLKGDLGIGHFNLALLEIYCRHDASAEQHLVRAIGLFEDLLESQTNSLNYQYRLATCCRVLADLNGALGKVDEALTLYGRAGSQMNSLVQTNPDVCTYRETLAGLHMNRGLLYAESGRPADALRCFGEADVLLARLVEEFPNSPRYQRDVAATWHQTGCVLVATGKREAARQKLEQARACLQQLAKDRPEIDQYRAELAAVEQEIRALPAEPVAGGE